MEVLGLLFALFVLAVMPFVLLAVALKVLFALVLLPLKIVGVVFKGLLGLVGLVVGLASGLFGLLAGGIGLVVGLLFLFLVLVMLPLAPLLLLGGLVWLALKAFSPGPRPV